LIHAVIWPPQIWAENWGTVSLWGGALRLHLTQCGQRRGLRAKFHLDPPNHLATVNERHKQTDKQTDRTTLR